MIISSFHVCLYSSLRFTSSTEFLQKLVHSFSKPSYFLLFALASCRTVDNFDFEISAVEIEAFSR